METETYLVEITIGNTIKKQTINTIPIFAFQEFQNLILQLARDSRPCKVKFARNEQVWLEQSQIFKIFENYVEFKNIAYGDRD